MARGVFPVIAVLLAFVMRAATGPATPKVVRTRTLAAEDTAPDRGRRVYESYGCATCHGAKGEGGFANPNAQTAGKVPPVMYVAEGYTEKELRKKLRDGVSKVEPADPKAPTPPYRMPGWASQMSGRELDDLVAYLMSLYPKSEKEDW